MSRAAVGALVVALGITGNARAVCNTAGAYVAASGDVVASPRCKGFGDEGARYRCRDGSFSHAEHRRGACSSHGGVAQELQPEETK